MIAEPQPHARPSLARRRSTFGRRIDTPAAASDAIVALGRQQLPGQWKYALIREPTRTTCKPVVYGSSADLAKAIHRERGDQGIELVEAPLKMRFEPEARSGVSVFLRSEDGARTRLIGWAYLDGGGRDALRDVLFAAEPSPAGWGA